MTNHAKICAIINAGHIAQVEFEDWKYQLFVSINSDWSVRWSDIYTSTKACYDSLWTYLYSKKQVENGNIKSISVYKCSLRYPKEWELVTILDTILDEPTRESTLDWYKEMIGWPFVVEKPICGYCVVNSKNKSDRFGIDYRHIVPYLWEENKTDDLSKWKEMTFTVNGKEYKAIIQ